MSSTVPLRPGDPVRVGDYEVTGRIGEGGQGSVFLARTPAGESVAIKVLRPGPAGQDTVGPGSPDRFLRETEILRRVAPFCTAQVVESGTADGRPYIVSEYIEGPTLQQVVDAEGPLRTTRLHRLAVGTLTALSAIHRAGVVHRDFKPSNVLLGRDGPRVIDFGIARVLDTSATGSGAIGTPPYMAPEQLEGGLVEPPADLFAWGSTMVFAATGRPPFGMDSLPAVVNRILHREPDLGDLQGDLGDLIADCLSKDPARRPAARDALLRLLGAQERPAGTDLLSAGSAVAAGATPPPSPPGETSAPSPPVETPAPASPGEIVTVPGAASAGRPGVVRLAAGAVALALLSGGVVYLLGRTGDAEGGGPASPSAGSVKAVAEVTAAPGPATSTTRLPGLKTTLHENPADPVRMSSFMYIGGQSTQSYERDPVSGRFTATGPLLEPAMSPDGRWTAMLPWLKDQTPQPYDFVRLVERASGREFVVRLTDKRLQNYNPQWSSDSRRLLLTTYDNSSGVRKPVGFAVVDVATTAVTPATLDAEGADGAPVMWAPGERTVALRYGRGPSAGLRFYDLRGRTVRTIPDVGEAYATENAISPAGKSFVTTCPDVYGSMCVWDTATGRRRSSFSVGKSFLTIGWFNDAYVMYQDTSKNPQQIIVADLKGRTARVLADIPASEDNGKPGTSVHRFTRR
ncbi:protein kinase domain-containing protein [Sphaerisporangium rhizosphaerae]|uniref:Protein kinase n=1 Tax=Sphaerisporangium rhizosphaerae TaxID=2269375 RepID=A0ABW2P9G9_9ACTN